MATKSPNGGIVWNAEEKAKMVAARPEITTCKTVIELTDLIFAAQAVLPKRVHRERKSIYDSLRGGGMDGTYAKSFREAETLTTTATEGEPAAEPTKMRWTNDEYTMLAHDPEVQPLLGTLEAMSTSDFVDLMLRAQNRQIDAPRRRPRKSLSIANYNSSAGKKLATLIVEGSARKPTRAIVPLERQSAPEQIEQTEVADVAIETPAPQTQAPANVSGPSPLSLAIVGFANTFIGQLKASVMEALSQSFDTKLAATLHEATAELEKSNIANIAALLGGTAPQAPAEQIAVPTPAVPKGPRVDVVGLLNGQATELKKIVGNTFDLRCFTADEAKRQDLTASTIMLVTGHIPHSVKDRAEATGANVVHVNGRTSAVVKALQELRAH